MMNWYSPVHPGRSGRSLVQLKIPSPGSKSVGPVEIIYVRENQNIIPLHFCKSLMLGVCSLIGAMRLDGKRLLGTGTVGRKEEKRWLVPSVSAFLLLGGLIAALLVPPTAMSAVANLNPPHNYPTSGPGTHEPGSSTARMASSVVGIITTFAGSGVEGFSGDGGPATEARLNEPADLAFDRSGNLYIADKNNHRLRRVDATGEFITTAVGNGNPEASTESTVSSEVSIGLPNDVLVDSAGNLYIADVFNSRILKLDPDGTIATIAGLGSNGFSGDGAPAVQAQLNVPTGLALDLRGNLFIADRGNHRIRQVNLTSGIITTVAGDGTAGFSGDGGPATSASLNYPSGIAVDSQGNLLIADTLNGRIRMVGIDGTISTLAGSQGLGFSGDGGPATEAKLNWPTSVAEDWQGNLFIADSNNNRIRRVSADGIISTVAGNGADDFSGDGGPATEASLSFPTAVVLNSQGQLFIADLYNHRIRKVTLVEASPQPAPTPMPTSVVATPSPPETVPPSLIEGGGSGSGGGFAPVEIPDGATPSMPLSATPIPEVPMAVFPMASPWTMPAYSPNPTITPVPTPTAMVSPTPTPAIPPPGVVDSGGGVTGKAGFPLAAVLMVMGLVLVGGLLGLTGFGIIYLIQTGGIPSRGDTMAFKNR
jgi:sugar lactone lactonase YvrE